MLRVPEHPEGDGPHAVVIGSGFGGMAAAIRLAVKGYRVTVVEKLDAPGGRAYVFNDDGFVFDAGPTVITAPFLFEELWELCGRKLSDDVDLRPVDPFFRMEFDDGSTFDYVGDMDEMRRQIAEFNKDDVAGFDRFMKNSEKIFKIGFLKMADMAFETIPQMMSVVPDLVRLGGHRSVYANVAKYIKDERLRVVMSFHPLLIGGNPFTTTAFYNLIGYLEQHWGVHFAMGGTGSLIKGMVKLFQGQGGVMRYNAQVDRIRVANGKADGVILTTGEEIDADLVVSNADSAFTYKHLLRKEPRKRWTDAKLERTDYSMSIFLWYFGTDRKYEDVAHHTILLGPRYKGLLDDIFKNKVLAEDFSLYLHRPTATDPSMAPEGCDAFYALVPVPHLQSGTDWEAQAEPYRQRVEQRLSETLLPNLKDHVVSSRMVTPLYFRDTLLSHNGAAFGIEPLLFQSAWFRPHNRSEEVANLYLVGAGTHPGAGLPGVLTTAKIVGEALPDVHPAA